MNKSLILTVIFIDLILSFTLLNFSDAMASSQEVQRGRARIDELFKWKVSDTLQLDSKDELKLSEMIKDISEQKSKIAEAMDQISLKLTKEKSSESRKILLKKYRSLMKENYEVQNKELDDFEKQFGTEHLAKYLELKFELKNKFRDYLSEGAQASGGAKTLSDPKIIEEK